MTLVPLVLPLLYLLLHSLLVGFSRNLPRLRKARVLLVNLFLAACLGGLLWWLRGSGVPQGLALTLSLWSPIVFFWWAYLWSRYTLDSLHPPGWTIDPWLIRFDEKIGQPSLHWARRGNRWLSEILHVFYAGYYLYTLVLGIFLQVSGRTTDFQRLSTAVCFGYLVSYLLFALLPAYGPRWSLIDEGLLRPEEQKSEGYLSVRFINLLMYGGPAHKGGAMPSGHTATAVVFLWWCWFIWGWTGGVAASVLVLGMVLGALYGRYHFVSDILAGILLGVLSLLFAESLAG